MNNQIIHTKTSETIVYGKDAFEQLKLEDPTHKAVINVQSILEINRQIREIKQKAKEDNLRVAQARYKALQRGKKKGKKPMFRLQIWLDNVFFGEVRRRAGWDKYEVWEEIMDKSKVPMKVWEELRDYAVVDFRVIPVLHRFQFGY